MPIDAGLTLHPHGRIDVRLTNAKTEHDLAQQIDRLFSERHRLADSLLGAINEAWEASLGRTCEPEERF